MTGALGFGGVHPTLGQGVYIAPTGYVIGDVHLGDECSLWFGAICRGDVGWIRVGKRTNIQDGAVVHVTGGKANTTIGSEVTIGHRAVVHGCRIEDGCLIGMGSIVMDDARVGEGSIVAAGAVVAPRFHVPPGSIVAGVPAKVVRQATEQERTMGRLGAQRYVGLAARYREEGIVG